MVQKNTPSPASFAEKYREVIRVGFNWDRFFQELWPVEMVRLDTQDSLARCFMPWYIGTTADEVAYDDPKAHPMSLADVPKAFAILNPERQQDIQQYVDSFKTEKGIVEFSVPTYALPDQQYFVLDRNHRLSALALNPVPFAVTLWNVCGPLDSECLLDLIHWESAQES